MTLNLHHSTEVLRNSRVVPLGLIRVQERATAEYLQDLIRLRLENAGLSMDDIVAAATDAGSNVVKAVELMGLRKQECFVHGLDLVVRKTVYGDKATAFDVNMLATFTSEINEETEENQVPLATDSREEIEEGCDPEPNVVLLGEAVGRLRDVCRSFKRKPFMMDEIRRTTEKDEFNGKRLKVVLDCRTRWYSTYVMIERALLILPALNNVLSRHGVPISAKDAEALEKTAVI